MSRITARKRVTRITVATSRSVRDDLLAVEEPLEIRVGGNSLAITMRTRATTSTSPPGSWCPRA